jgi:hypothetical protein
VDETGGLAHPFGRRNHADIPFSETTALHRLLQYPQRTALYEFISDHNDTPDELSMIKYNVLFAKGSALAEPLAKTINYNLLKNNCSIFSLYPEIPFSISQRSIPALCCI